MAHYIYRKIFKLSALKFCKILFETKSNIDSLPMSNNEYSSIEHLAINNTIYFDALDRLLSYLPDLRQLKLRYLAGYKCKRTQLCPIELNYLSDISLKLVFIYFNIFEQLIKDNFHQVQCLRISTEDDITYLDGNHWEQLILSFMPNLRTFHMNYSNSILCNDRIPLSYDALIEKFTSLFWIERQCSFTHEKDWMGSIDIEIFFSTDPHKKKYNKTFKLIEANTCSSHQEINLNSINHIHLCCIEALNKYKNYFQNVTDLTVDCKLDSCNRSITTTLNRIIPLPRITKLIIEFRRFSFIQLIELLCLTPNVHTLKLDCISIHDREYTSIEQSQSFQYASKRNIIKNIILNETCTLEKVKILVALCPRLEDLNIEIDRKNLASIIRFLLSQTNAHHLFFVCTSGIPKSCLEEIKTLIKLEKLHDCLF
ncbi:unnamed protein product, partial [Rotaria sordida]